MAMNQRRVKTCKRKNSHFNPLCAERFWSKMINVFEFIIVDMAYDVEILPHGSHGAHVHLYDKSEYHKCWCLGDIGGQGISIRGMDLVVSEYPRLSTKRVNHILEY